MCLNNLFSVRSFISFIFVFCIASLCRHAHVSDGAYDLQIYDEENPVINVCYVDKREKRNVETSTNVTQICSKL